MDRPAVTLALAREVAGRVGTLDGVVAVALGGSLARGRGDAHSDVDLGLCYDPARPFAIEALRALVTELDDRHAPELVGFGDWGPWINGGAWTRTRGAKLDLLYRDLRLVDRVLDDCEAGRITCDYQPGHPHGFHNHIYAGEVHHGLALHDPDGALAEGKARTSPYPPAVGRAIVRRHLWEAGFAVQTAAAAARRGDLAYVSGCLFRAVACLVQVLFAVNGRWFVNEKGSVAEAAGLPRTPPGFAAGVEEALSGLRPDPWSRTRRPHRVRARTNPNPLCSEFAGGHYLGASGGLVLAGGVVLEGGEVVEGVGAGGGWVRRSSASAVTSPRPGSSRRRPAGCWPSWAGRPRTSTPCWRPSSTAPAASAGPTSR